MNMMKRLCNKLIVFKNMTMVMMLQVLVLDMGRSEGRWSNLFECNIMCCNYTFFS